MPLELDRFLKSMRVIAVDDSRSFVMGLKGLLTPHVLEVDTFTDASSALVAVNANPPDFLITDLEMEELSGLDLIREVRKNERFNTIPILVLTGRTSAEVLADVIQQGADAFVTKSEIRTHIFPNLLAMARMRDSYKKAIQGKQLESIKALIGTYKHEFGNAIAAIDGKLRKMERSFPILVQDETYLAIQKWNLRLEETLKKLDELRRYEEEKYVGSAHVLKVG